MSEPICRDCGQPGCPYWYSLGMGERCPSVRKEGNDDTDGSPGGED